MRKKKSTERLGRMECRSARYTIIITGWLELVHSYLGLVIVARVSLGTSCRAVYLYFTLGIVHLIKTW